MHPTGCSRGLRWILPAGLAGDGRGETRLMRPLQPSASSRDPQNPWVCFRSICPMLAVSVPSAFPGLPQQPFFRSASYQGAEHVKTSTSD